MTTPAAEKWLEANQRGLIAALAEVRTALDPEAPHDQPESSEPAVALEGLCAAFGLSAFERGVLLLCAGVELDSGFPAACAAAHGDPFPTFGLALAALADPHWSALAPAAPLRRWHLIELTGPAPLTAIRLRIAERVLHHLVGVAALDQRLAGLAERLHPDRDLVPSEDAVAQRMVELCTAAVDDGPLPVLQLCGTDRAARSAVAANACARLGLGVLAVAAHRLPTHPAELDTLARLLEREASLDGCAVLLDGDDLDDADPARLAATEQLAATVGVPLVISSVRRRGTGRRSTVMWELDRATPAEQRTCWHEALGEQVAPDVIEGLVARFDLGPQAIRDAGTQACGTHPPAGELAAALWTACRSEARPALDGLAVRVEPAAGWDDLVVPPAQRSTLEQVAVHVEHRLRVYDDWQLGRVGGRRGLGTSALFTGPSGTGKTLAAEVLAHELGLDLFRVDLSQVVSKYIGETEKNLRRVFDAADRGSAVLLFDEADALFGKRSEVRDSHDRYANIEIGYLLQRMEAYRGLAVLTTNLDDALDQAFLRRLRFVVGFPFPDAALRAELWRRAFPAATPTKDLDADQLARLNLSGGHIRNVAVNAAFRAAGDGEPVAMRHLERAARAEYAKLDKPIPATVLTGWG